MSMSRSSSRNNNFTATPATFKIVQREAGNITILSTFYKYSMEQQHVTFITVKDAKLEHFYTTKFIVIKIELNNYVNR